MKLSHFIFCIIILLLASQSVVAQTPLQTDTITVNGECESCKKRIEKTTLSVGVIAANWNETTKNLVVTYAPAKVTNAQIQLAIAAAGHDTEKATASKAAYLKLPECCQYERKKIAKTH